MKKFSVLALGLSLALGLNLAFAGGEVVELGGLKSKVPDTWKKQKPANRLRIFQFSVRKAEGDKSDAEVVIFAAGGSLEANIERWKKQFNPPQGKTIDEVTKVEKFSIGKTADVAVVEISGTFLYTDPSNPKAKATPKANFRRLNVLFSTDGGTYSMTFTGPAKTIEKNKAAFHGWIKSFK